MSIYQFSIDLFLNQNKKITCIEDMTTPFFLEKISIIEWLRYLIENLRFGNKCMVTIFRKISKINSLTFFPKTDKKKQWNISYFLYYTYKTVKMASFRSNGIYTLYIKE